MTVVLSACETALGKLSNGDELVGLTRAFIYAGTPSVIATLWKVNDRASYELMREFYLNLKTMKKSEAHRLSMTLVKSPVYFFSSRLAHPLSCNVSSFFSVRQNQRIK
jgi:CHAT domain-containing protein